MFVSVGPILPPTPEQFTAKVGMTLFSGDELVRIIAADLRRRPLSLPVTDSPFSRNTQKCGMAMVRRMARRGPHSGEEFWCSTYPTCLAGSIL